MVLKRKKRTVRLCTTVMTCFVVTCVILCPIFRLVMESLSLAEQEVAPHSLQNQLLRTSNSTSAADTTPAVRVNTRRNHVKPEHAALRSEVQSNSYNTNHDSKLSMTKNAKVQVPKESHEHKKQSLIDKTVQEGNNNNNITLLRHTIQEMAKNSSLTRESNRRHKELDVIANKLRITTTTTNATNRRSVEREAPAVPDTISEDAKTHNLPSSKVTETHNASSQVITKPSKRVRLVKRSSKRHYPTFLSKHALVSSLKRRMNLVTPYTGCSIAAFQYNLGKHAHPEFNDCFVHCGKPFARTRGIRIDNAQELVKENDTIFVQLNKLDHFVNKTMHLIDVDYVIMSGNEQKVPPISKKDFDAIVNNPRVLHWFMSNMDVYSHDLNHPKISPWPYGSNPKKLDHFARELLRDPPPERNATIYLSGFSRATNPQRFHIPGGPKVPIEDYLRQMHSSTYIVSPDGDRPECYRHYEAIGMGCMPITQMDAKTHSHLEGNVVFNNTDWNLTTLAASLPPNPHVNQRLIFEEYWMEYVERIVGRPLRWYDPSRDVHSSLEEIQNLVANDILEPRKEVCVVANGTPFVGRRAAPSEGRTVRRS